MVDLVAKTPFDQQLAQFFANFDVHHSVLLTPNKRLSRFFVERYSAMQSTTAFTGLHCLAIHTWIGQLWSDLAFVDEHPLGNFTLLSNFQENLLWENLIDHYPDTPPLINARATARQAQDAWGLMHEWRLDKQALGKAARANGDPFIFQGWYQEFERICERDQLLSVVQIPGLLVERLEKLDPLLTSPSVTAPCVTLPPASMQSFPGGTINSSPWQGGGREGVFAPNKSGGRVLLPQQIFLYGFDELSPAIKHLLDCLKNLGVKISSLDLQVAENSAKRIEFINEQQELEAVARWAREKITTQPELTVGIVVPNLTSQRSRVERVFMREFEPQYIFPDQAQHATGFNISAGQPLAQVPIISAGLDALACQSEKLELHRLSALLRSPFVGSTRELSTRALWDVALHDLGELELSFQQFKALISESIAKINNRSFQELSSEMEDLKNTESQSELTEIKSDFYQRLGDFDLLRKQNKKVTRYPSQWCSIFIEKLKTWGWPGDRQLDTLEFQQIQSWQETLEEFSGLDYLLGKIDHAKALEVLTLALQQTAFHAQTRSSPLQILGLLEAAGLPFDELWVLGLDDDTWPPTAKPNPLLPLSIQRELNLPQSSPEREYFFAHRLTQRLTQSSVNLYASSVTLKGDKQLSASPLIKNFQLFDFVVEAVQQHEQRLFTSRQMETCLDYCGPRITDLESIRGGSQILKSQATCPFQAFARYRLHSSEIPVPGIGLSAMERGNLLHKVMEIIWRILREQSQLLALSDEKLLALINKASAHALTDIRQKRIAGHRFLQLETQRLATQVLQWLQLEKQRKPFKVLFNEGRKTVKLEKMPIHIRYDRVDELDDGSLFVLDYKTGETSIRDWTGTRPNEPQVPLYAIANAKRVAGAAFGQISTDKILFNGIAEDSEIAPGLIDPHELPKMDLPESWPDILQHWETVLSRLAREFLAGSAAVDPKHPSTSCRYCELHALCRIREQYDFDAPNPIQDDADVSGELADAD
jgi:ATP-dependent helicase/nuclease subunit B